MFVHLHVHSAFSFGDGAARLDHLVDRATQLGQGALALTDHDGLSGAIRFYRAAMAAGIRPVLGCELTLSSGSGKRKVGGESAAGMPDVSQAIGGEVTGGGGSGEGEGGAGASSSSSAADDRRRSAAGRPVIVPPTLRPGYHLTLLARDIEGYANLCRLVTHAHLDRPRGSPALDPGLLPEHAEGLIALSGCRRGEVPSLVRAGRLGEARRAAERYAAIFGRENFLIELQNDLGPDAGVLCERLWELAGAVRLGVVATNNVHYATATDHRLHDVIAAAAALERLPGPAGRSNGELYLKSEDQMRRLFRDFSYAVDCAGGVAERCRVELDLDTFRFPTFSLDSGETAYSQLAKLAWAGAVERYPPLSSEVVARLEKELRVVDQLGFPEYFLVVWDICRFARERGIFYSGRGSAGNSILAYCLRITDADPIEHGLLFERFMNSSRREMPDIDVDFCSRRRDEVIDYIYRRYGTGSRLAEIQCDAGEPQEGVGDRSADGHRVTGALGTLPDGPSPHVAVAATVCHLTARSAVRLVGRAFGLAPAELDRLSRPFPHVAAGKVREALDELPELRDSPLREQRFAQLVDLVERLDGFPTHLGTHLGGFVISGQPLTDLVPLQVAGKGVVATQYDKDDIEALGLVKMDILGLRMHSALSEAVDRVEARTGSRLDVFNLPHSDERVYEVIRSARTVGLFQIESSGQRNLAQRLQHERFGDLIASISLFRPGPLKSYMVPSYIRRRHRLEPVLYLHPALEPILKDTYGVVVYQEQVLEMASRVAGFTLDDADALRRQMTHDRSPKEWRRLGEVFVERARRRGFEREAASGIWEQLKGFAAYGFVKGHAACFAVITYASAYLKAHWPAELFCGLMNNQPMGYYTPRAVLNDARHFGLDIRGVDVNASEGEFCPEDEGRALRVGFAYVREMSSRDIDRILTERKAGGSYRSFLDFYRRTAVELPAAENLIKVGAFDSLGVGRRFLIERLPLLHRRRGRGSAGQTAVFDDPEPQGETPLSDRVGWELELLGLSVSAHPFELCRDELRRLGVVPSDRLPGLRHGARVQVAGIYERVQQPHHRGRRPTKFLTLEDEAGLLEVVVFWDCYQRYGQVLSTARHFLVEGVWQNDPEHGQAVVAERLFDLEEVLEQGRKIPGHRHRARAGPISKPAGESGGGWAGGPAGESAGGRPEDVKPGREAWPTVDSRRRRL